LPIRWAASGNAEGDEKLNLTRGLKRLVEEATHRKEKQPTKAQKVEEELETEAFATGAS